MTRVAAITERQQIRQPILLPLIMQPRPVHCFRRLLVRCRYSRCRLMLPLRTALSSWKSYRHERWFSSSPISFRGPFKVLFCGSDEFSIGSLQAVLEAKGELYPDRKEQVAEYRCLEKHTCSDPRCAKSRQRRSTVEKAKRGI